MMQLQLFPTPKPRDRTSGKFLPIYPRLIAKTTRRLRNEVKRAEHAQGKVRVKACWRSLV